MDIRPYRKAVIACIAAVVTVCQAFDISVASELSDNFVAVFDAVAAFLVYAVPND